MSEAMHGLWTEKEFLGLVKISRATLYKYKAKRLVSYLKCGRRTLYDEKSLEDFKNNCAQRVEANSTQQAMANDRAAL